MRINKVLVSVLVIASLFNAPAMRSVESKDSVTLAAGTSNEYVVPADADSVLEDNISKDFVQEDTKSLNFEKLNLEGLSGNLNTVINDVYAKADGTFVVLVTITNDSSSLVGELYAHAFLLIVDINGVVQKSLNVSTGEVGDKTSAIKRPEEIGGKLANISAAYPILSVVDDTVYVSYTGYTPYSTTYTNQYFTTDIDFSTESIDWSTASDYEGATSSFAYSHNVYEYYDSEQKFTKSAEFFLRSNKANTSAIETEFEYAISNPINKTQTETRVLEVRSPAQMIEDIPGAEITVSGFRGFDNILKLSNGNLIGTMYVTYRDAGGQGKRAREICVWDSDGNLISYHAATHGNGRHIQYEISNEEKLYFREDADDATYLMQMDIETGDVSEVTMFPAGTNITIRAKENEDFNSQYEYFGYSYSGLDGSAKSGATVGTMDDEFNIISSNIIATSPPITMNLIDDDNGNVFIYGSLSSNKTFANEPTADTNSIANQGWVDKNNVSLYGANNNVYFGSMLKVVDYAPAINVGDSVKINKDMLTTSVDEVLISSIEVYDTFDFSLRNPANDNLTDEEIKQKLISRINRNPNDISTDIEWESLGLDMSTPGYNEVKFFVSDSNNQVSADSKVVNVITNQTVENKDLALDANNFHIELADVSKLTKTELIEKSQVYAWNMKTGSKLDVSINDVQFENIRSTKTDGVFDISLTAKESSKVVTKKITVFVGGVTNIDKTNVLYASSFKVHLNDAKDFTADEAVNESKAVTYTISSGEILEDVVSVNISNVNAAKTIGPVKVNVNCDSLGIGKQVIASIYDETVVFGVNDAISAKSVVFNLADIRNLNATKLKSEIGKRSIVKAWNQETGEVESFTFSEKNVKAKSGEYPLSFVTTSKTEKKIQVYVYDLAVCNGSGCAGTNATEVITANNFSVLPGDVKNLNDAKVVSLAKAKAINLITDESLTVKSDYSAIKKDFGSYDVKFSSNEISVSVKANVGDNINVDQNVAIAASDTFFTMDEVKAFNSKQEFDAEILTRSNAKVWVVETNTQLDPIVLDTKGVDYETLDKTGFSVEYSYVSSDGVVERTDRVLNEEVEEIEEDAISAKDFSITAKEVEDLTPGKVIDYADAKSWMVSDDSEVEFIGVDFENVEAKQGVYDIVFTNENENTFTVKVFVGSKNRPNINLEENIVTFANDYELDSNKIKDITSVDHIEAAEVMIINKSTLEQLDVDYVNAKSFDGESGTYISTFGSNQKDITSVTVTVVSDDLETVNYAVGKMMLGLLLIGLVVVIRFARSSIEKV